MKQPVTKPAIKSIVPNPKKPIISQEQAQTLELTRQASKKFMLEADEEIKEPEEIKKETFRLAASAAVCEIDI